MSSTAHSSAPTKRRWLPSFGVQVLIGLVLGVVVGLIARSMGADGVDSATGEVDPNWLTETLTIVGRTFVALLRAIVPPLVFLALLASLANLRAVTAAAPLALKTLASFATPAPIAAG